MWFWIIIWLQHMICWSNMIFFNGLWFKCKIKILLSKYHQWGECYEGHCFSLLQVQVTGSTLNGRKERLQAEEGEKEKWDFLQFAEAWTPNEISEELRNEVLFTHVRRLYDWSFSIFQYPETTTLLYIVLNSNLQLFVLLKASLHIKLKNCLEPKNNRWEEAAAMACIFQQLISVPHCSVP